MSETRQQKREQERQRKKKIKEAIKMINDVVKLRLAPSEIHGVGVFAMRDIKAGERLYANAIPCMIDIPRKDLNKIQSEIRQMILERFPRLTFEDTKFLAPDTLMQLYINHSDEPNYHGETDKAIRKIKTDEEITEDYRCHQDWIKVYKWLNEYVDK